MDDALYNVGIQIKAEKNSAYFLKFAWEEMYMMRLISIFAFLIMISLAFANISLAIKPNEVILYWSFDDKKVAGKVASTPGISFLWSNDFDGRMLKGILDEIVIIKRAVNEAEMKDLMEKGLGASEVAYTGRLATTWADLKR